MAQNASIGVQIYFILHSPTNTHDYLKTKYINGINQQIEEQQVLTDFS